MHVSLQLRTSRSASCVNCESWNSDPSQKDSARGGSVDSSSGSSSVCEVAQRTASIYAMPEQGLPPSP